jgi:hypothetical protein
MQVSSEQMSGMLAGDDRLLRQAIQAQVRDEHSYVVQGLPQDLFDRMVGGGMQRARGYGLTRPADLSCFVLLMFEFGPEFWRHPAIAQVLTDPALPPEQRLQQVVNNTPDAVWKYLNEALPKQSWFPEAQAADEND